MANSEARTSSDDEQALGGEYQVFLNFRGPDTRHGFTSFLYHGLVDAGVNVFMDNDELRAGEEIPWNLLHAIDNSMIYIPIFSRNYASSSWCLRELVHMVENCSKSMSWNQKSILPIFFDVEPNDVKGRSSLYSESLRQHRKRFPHEYKAWEDALQMISRIRGWSCTRDQSQAEIVKLVIETVLEKLKTKKKLVTKHLVGLDDRVTDLMKLLDVDHFGARLITIHGMGGIGKTTIAKVIFNALTHHFGKHCSFLEDVRKSSSTEEGIVQLQRKLLSDIVGSASVEKVKDSEQGMQRIGEILPSKKVFVVLDDVDNKEHIKKLTGNCSLHSRSRIIITTRNPTILQVGVFKGEVLPYKMPKMEDGPALQLFCQHAFGRVLPSDNHPMFFNEIVSSMGGLPLAIEVIGSLLNGKNKAFWEAMLVKFKDGALE